MDDEQTPTLVGVLGALDAANQTGGEIPKDALAPRIWMVFTLWIAEQGDIGKTFTQKIEIFTPDGKLFGNSQDDFQMSNRSHNVKMRVHGLPIGLEGRIIIKTHLESLATKVTEVHESFIDIRHKRVKSA